MPRSESHCSSGHECISAFLWHAICVRHVRKISAIRYAAASKAIRECSSSMAAVVVDEEITRHALSLTESREHSEIVMLRLSAEIKSEDPKFIRSETSAVAIKSTPVRQPLEVTHPGKPFAIEASQFDFSERRQRDSLEILESADLFGICATTACEEIESRCRAGIANVEIDDFEDLQTTWNRVRGKHLHEFIEQAKRALLMSYFTLTLAVEMAEETARQELLTGFPR
jgi:hypothetical protein